MVNVITFSLYGNGEMYLVGAIENAKLAKKFYPDFECWYYVHKESITEDIIKKIDAFDNTKIILKSGNLLNVNQWHGDLKQSMIQMLKS